MLEFLDVSTKKSEPLVGNTIGVQQQVAQPAFITTASLGTFAGGSVFITAIWKVLAKIFDTKNLWIPGILAAILGAYFFWKSIQDDKVQGADVMGALLVAICNASILWAAAVGLDVGLDETSIASTSTG